MAVRAVVIGDAHIKSRIWLRHPIIGDAIFAFERAIRWGASNGAELIVLAGDICDPVNTENLDHYHRSLSRAPDARVIGIQGQHDWASPSLLSVLDVRGEDIHREIVEAAGFTFYGIENTPKDRLRVLLDDVPPVDFLVLHQLATPCQPIGWDLDPAWIPPHVGTVLCGDLHAQMEFDIPSGGKGWYTGALIPTRKGDVERTHSILAIEDDGSVRRVALPGRAFIHRVIDSEESIEKLAAEVSDPEFALPTVRILQFDLLPVVFIDYDPAIANVREEIARIEGVLKAFSAQVICEPTGAPKDIPQQSLDLMSVRMQDLVSEVEDDPIVQDLLVSILNDCRRETIDAWRKKHFPEMEEEDAAQQHSDQESPAV